MTSRKPAFFMFTVLIASTLLGTFSFVPAPAQALEFTASTAEDLLGSGGNTALLESVVVEDDMVKLATETYSIHDDAWSDSNVDGMTVDDNNKPELGPASHWTTYTGYDASGCFAHSVCWDSSSSRFLLFGGAHDQGGSRYIHNHLWSYNPEANSWTDLGGIDRPKLWHTGVWAESEGLLLIWGGATLIGDQLHALNETIAYRPSTQQWFAMAPNPWGGRVWHTAVWDSANDQMLVLGGTPDGTLANVTADLFAFKPSTNTWSRLASLPANQRRGGAAGFWDTQNDNFIIFGGQMGNNRPMTSVFSYKPSTNSWTQRANGPDGRVFHTMGWDPIGERAYSFGGLTGSAISARLYTYRPLQDSWNPVDEVAPDARFWSAFVWDPVHGVGLNFAGAATANNPISSYNDIMVYRTLVPYRTEGWLTSSIFDIGGILGVGNISWTPTSQPSALGDDPVRFQVASSSSIETPTNFVGPDGTPDTYYTDPTGTPVGSHHFGRSRIAYRMYFQTDDDGITPTVDTVDMSVHRYANRGTYTSPIYDLGQPKSRFERITYRSEIPPDTNPNLVKVTVRIRTSSNPQMQGATSWEEIVKDDTDIRTAYGRYFQVQVIITTDSQARHLTPLFKGITVSYNTPPTLAAPPSGHLDAIEGDRSTWFTYYVVYTDVDNDEPTVRDVYIDGVPYEMDSEDTDYTNGAIFTYETRHLLGDHEYYFLFSDGKNQVRDPAVGTYSGPSVLNLVPIAAIEYPASGTRFVPTEPVEFSAEGSFDPDLDKLSYMWTSSLQGQLSSEKAFLSILQEGVHLITLDIVDAQGANDSVAISILVKPYLPVLEIRDFYMDKTSPIEKDKVTINAVVYNIGEAEAVPAVVEFLVDGEVVDTYEQPMDVDDRIVTTFTWTAEGDIVNLAVRAKPGRGAAPDDEDFREVLVIPNNPPVIRFDVAPLVARTGQVVNFINNGTSDPEGDTMTYLWDFGDGTTSTEATTQHVFAVKGNFYVNLTVTDKRGGVSKQMYPISVKPRESGSSSAMTTTTMVAILVLVLAAVGAGGFLATRRKRPSAPPPPPPPPAAATARRPLPPPPPDWRSPAPEDDGGVYPPEGGEEYYPPEDGEGYYPPQGGEEYYPPDGEEEYYPPQGGEEYYPPDGEEEYYPPEQ